MASAKQIAWRKKFGRMAKAGKFKKSQTGTRLPSGRGVPRSERYGESKQFKEIGVSMSILGLEKALRNYEINEILFAEVGALGKDIHVRFIGKWKK